MSLFLQKGERNLRPAFGKIYPGYARRLVEASGRSKIAGLWCLEYLVEYCRFGHERFLSTREFQNRYRSDATGAPLRHASAVDGRSRALAERNGLPPLLKAVGQPTDLSPKVYPLQGVEPSDRGWGVLYHLEPRYWFAERLSVRMMAVCCELKRRAGHSRIALTSAGEIASCLGIPGHSVNALLADLTERGVIQIEQEEPGGNLLVVEVLTGFQNWSRKSLGNEPVLLDSHSSHAITLPLDEGSVKGQHSKPLATTGPPSIWNRTTNSLKPDRFPSETGSKLEQEPKNLRESSQSSTRFKVRQAMERLGELTSDLGVDRKQVFQGKRSELANSELRQWVLDGLQEELTSSQIWATVRTRLEKCGVPISRYFFRAIDILQDERGALLRRRKAIASASVESAANITRTAQLEEEMKL